MPAGSDQHVYESKIVRVSAAAAAGLTNVVATTVIDMAGWDGAHFFLAVGALTATQVTGLKIQQGDLLNGSDAADITGAVSGNLADGDSNKMAEVDVYRPTKRYLTAVGTRGTANAVVDGIFCILYQARVKPAAQDASMSKRKALIGV